MQYLLSNGNHNLSYPSFALNETLKEGASQEAKFSSRPQEYTQSTNLQVVSFVINRAYEIWMEISSTILIRRENIQLSFEEQQSSCESRLLTSCWLSCAVCLTQMSFRLQPSPSASGFSLSFKVKGCWSKMSHQMQWAYAGFSLVAVQWWRSSYIHLVYAPVRKGGLGCPFPSPG